MRLAGHRTIFILLAGVLSAMRLSAAEAPRVGDHAMVGDAALGAWSGIVDDLTLATDGDEVLMVWSSGFSRKDLYAQRLDRTGRLVTALPQRLDLESWASGRFVVVHVVWMAGFYHLFHTYFDVGFNKELRVARLTRDLQVVDIRSLGPTSYQFDVLAAGDEIVVVMDQRLLRLRTDLSVVDDVALPEATYRVSGSPRGPLIASSRTPAAVARFIGDGQSVRLGTLTEPYSDSAPASAPAQMVWTGSEYVAAWADCPNAGCLVWTARFDEQLRPIGESLRTGIPFFCGSGGCFNRFSLTPLADGSVLIAAGEWGRRVRDGIFLDTAIVRVGWTSIATAHGLLLAVDRELRVSVVAPPGPEAQKVVTHAAVQAAPEERLLDVAASDTEVAVVRQRFTAQGAFAVATIFDRQGSVRREVTLGNYTGVALATDGTDFYALGLKVSYSDTYFQKVANGARVTPLGNRLPHLLVWTGSAFLTAERDWKDEEGKYHTTTLLHWVDRDGKTVKPCGASFVAPGLFDRRSVGAFGGGEVLLAFPGGVVRFRDGCSEEPETQELSVPPRPAWQNGIWASVIRHANDLSLTTAPAGGSFTRAGSFAHRTPYPYEDTDIAAAAGRWVVTAKEPGPYFGRVHAWALDISGNVLGSTVVTDVGAECRLAPLGDDRVLAFYERQVFEPPFFGKARVFVTRLSIETVFRQRRVRP